MYSRCNVALWMMFFTPGWTKVKDEVFSFSNLRAGALLHRETELMWPMMEIPKSCTVKHCNLHASFSICQLKTHPSRTLYNVLKYIFYGKVTEDRWCRINSARDIAFCGEIPEYLRAFVFSTQWYSCSDKIIITMFVINGNIDEQTLSTRKCMMVVVFMCFPKM